MVNTCTGTYAGKSSEEANEALSLKAAMHGVRIRGQWFKSTLPRRPYRLPLKKSQADISKSCHKPMQKEVGSRGAAKDAKTGSSHLRLIFLTWISMT